MPSLPMFNEPLFSGDLPSSAGRLNMDRSPLIEPAQLSFTDIYRQVGAMAGSESQAQLREIAKNASGMEFSTPEMNRASGKEPDYFVDARGRLLRNPNSRAKPGDSLNIEIQGEGQNQERIVQSMLGTFRSYHPWMTAFPPTWQEVLELLQQGIMPGSGNEGNTSRGGIGRGGGNYGRGGGGNGRGGGGYGRGGGGRGDAGPAPSAVDNLAPPIEADGKVFPLDSFNASKVQLHHGTSDGAADLFAPEGTPIRAMVEGVVIKVGSGGLGGNTITIKQADGNVAYYAHMKSIAASADGTPLKSGDKILAGDVVGRVGQTGNAAGTGSHLHLGVGNEIQSGSGPEGGAGSNFNLTGTLNEILSKAKRV